MRLRFTSKLRWAASVLMVLALAIGIVPQVLAATGPIGTAAGFEDNDGNLIPEAPINFDWNSFAPTTWTGPAPNQTADKVFSGWHFVGLSDAQATNSDTGFKGGTKQDDSCAGVIGTKAPNKDDLKRIYVTHKQVLVGGVQHVFVELAWVRIPQNTTSASAHVAFEFNQGTTLCGAASDGLVQRVAGDLLIVYDFEGSATSNPTLTLRRWVASGACEVSSDTAPCWGPATDLTASGFAEAKVNTFGSVSDAIAPSPESLGTNEFGEAGIDLTAAGVFSPNVCTSFGQVEGVSRSSGNSSTAAMEDLVGPGHITIANCGLLTIKKVTDPSPDPTTTSFPFSLDGTPTQQDGYTLPQTFSLANGGSKTFEVFASNAYSATETVPANWVLASATCDNGKGNLAGDTLSGISVAADEHVTCTFVDRLLLGAIKITKTSSKTSALLAGATFSITGPSAFSTSVTTGSDGTVCVEHLPFGTYSVTETAAPTGYSIDDPASHDVVVNTNSLCGDGHEATYSATNTPLSDIQVRFRDGGSGATSATITCDNTTGTSSTANTTGWNKTLTVTGVKAPTTINCQIVIDP